LFLTIQADKLVNVIGRYLIIWLWAKN